MAEQEAKKVTKPAVVKKKKPSKPKTPADHPTYNEMIRAAIVGLGDRKGSSRQAIQKYVFANYKVGDPQKARVHIKLGLVRMEKSGVLQHTKGRGASGSFKLGDRAKAAKPKTKKAAAKKKPAAKKPAVKKAAKKSPKKAAKKSAAKKSPAKKAKAEKKASKPKKAKSPAKKKAAKKAKSPSKKKSAKKSSKKAAKK